MPLRHSVYSHDGGPEGGESMIDTSAALRVVWRVEVPGRSPYELEEDRSAPMWLQSNSLGSGNRWYKVRIRPQYGLMPDIGVPVVVDPGDACADLGRLGRGLQGARPRVGARGARAPRGRPAQGRHRRRALRIGHPLTGKLRPEDEVYVEQTIEREAARDKLQAKYAPPPVDPALAAESAELNGRMDELTPIHGAGVKTLATVVARKDTARTSATSR